VNILLLTEKSIKILVKGGGIPPYTTKTSRNFIPQQKNPTLGELSPPSTEVNVAYAHIVVIIVVTSNLIYLLYTNLLVGVQTPPWTKRLSRNSFLQQYNPMLGDILP